MTAEQYEIWRQHEKEIQARIEEEGATGHRVRVIKDIWTSRKLVELELRIFKAEAQATLSQARIDELENIVEQGCPP